MLLPRIRSQFYKKHWSILVEWVWFDLELCDGLVHARFESRRFGLNDGQLARYSLKFSLTMKFEVRQPLVVCILFILLKIIFLYNNNNQMKESGMCCSIAHTSGPSVCKQSLFW